MNILGEKLKQYRKSSMQTQEDIAKYVGVSTRTIRAYEAGVRKPDAFTLHKILEKVDVKGPEHDGLILMLIHSRALAAAGFGDMRHGPTGSPSPVFTLPSKEDIGAAWEAVRLSVGGANDRREFVG